MKRLGVDIDGVLRNLIPEINKVFEKHYPEYVEGKVAYDYNFPHIKMPLKDKFNVIFNEYPKDVFLKSKPYAGIIEQFQELKSWCSNNNIRLICATSQELHLIGLTYSWLGKYNITFEEMHITKNKGAIGLDYIIDDAPHNFENWIKNGNPAENFFLMDRDWNKNEQVPNRIKRLTDIIQKIN